MFIDTHCHLMFPQFNDDRPAVIGNAKKAGVKQFVVPGVDELSSKLAVEMAREFPGIVHAGIGFHPYEASHAPPIDLLTRLLTHNRKEIVAIGECGLDYHLYKGETAAGKKQEQRLLFEQQCRIALAHDLPLIMHCREAYEDFFTVLDALPQMPRGVIHCFSGGLQELRMAQERHFFVGVDGNVTYSKQLQPIISQVPLPMLLLETDAPYLTPAPHRGERNEPKYIPLIAKAIAQLHSTPVTEVEEVRTINARSLFSL